MSSTIAVWIITLDNNKNVICCSCGLIIAYLSIKLTKYSLKCHFYSIKVISLLLVDFSPEIYRQPKSL